MHCEGEAGLNLLPLWEKVPFGFAEGRIRGDWAPRDAPLTRRFAKRFCRRVHYA
jgi:hypothetical protein